MEVILTQARKHTNPPEHARLSGRRRRRLHFADRGAIAQLGERLDRTQEVAGSSPASSTQEDAGNGVFLLGMRLQFVPCGRFWKQFWKQDGEDVSMSTS